MSSSSHRQRLDRGLRAQEALRHQVMAEAADELNHRAFNDFISAAESPKDADALRERALRRVLGAESFLDILREWAAEAAVLREMEEAGDV